MARPKNKKNRYVVELSPISNFVVKYYNDDEEVEHEIIGAEWSEVMRRVIQHNQKRTDSPELILPF